MGVSSVKSRFQDGYFLLLKPRRLRVAADEYDPFRSARHRAQALRVAGPPTRRRSSSEPIRLCGARPRDTSKAWTAVRSSAKPAGGPARPVRFAALNNGKYAIALLPRFRRLRVRWEIRDDIHQAFMSLACSIVSFSSATVTATKGHRSACRSVQPGARWGAGPPPAAYRRSGQHEPRYTRPRLPTNGHPPTRPLPTPHRGSTPRSRTRPAGTGTGSG